MAVFDLSAVADQDSTAVVDVLVQVARTRAQFDQSELVAALSNDPARFDAPPAGLIRFLLDEVLVCPDPRPVLRAVFASPVGAMWYPEVAALAMPPLPGAKHKDNLDHSIRVAANVPARRMLRWAALCHDLGKPATRQVLDGEVTFIGHETVGSRITRKFLTRLGFDADFVDDVVTCVALSGRAADFDLSWSDSAVRRFMTDAGDLFDDVCWLTRGDCTSRFPDRRRRAHQRVDQLRIRAAEIRAKDTERARRPVIDGSEIMAILGLEPGPLVGEARKHLLRVDPDGTLGRDQAESVLRTWFASRA